MNQLGIRNNGLTQRVGSAKVLDHALIYDFGNILPLTRDRISVLRAGLVILNLIKARNVGARNARKTAQDLLTGGPGIAQALVLAEDLDYRLLALTYKNRI